MNSSTRYIDFRRLARDYVPERAEPDPLRRLSLSRIIEAQTAPGGRVVDGLEGEVHAELVRQHGPVALRGGTVVPLGIRDLTVGTAADGGNLVGAAGAVPTIGASLRAASHVLRAGAQVLEMQPASTGIPVGAGLTATWQATETTALPAASVTFAHRALAPKLVGITVKVSRRVMTMAPLLDAYLVAEMGRALAQAVDAAVLNGSGSSGEPLGILGTSGIGTFSGTSLNTAGVLNAERDVIDAGALYDESARGWFTNGTVGELLKGRLRTGNGSRYVADHETGTYRIGTAPLYETAAMPAATLVYGDFSQVLVAAWPTVELLVNRYKVSAAGTIELSAWAAVDVAVVHPESFSVATSVT